MSSGVTLRRRLPPLLLKVHPDLFHQAPAEVRATNLQCVQRINELAAALDRLALQQGRLHHPLLPHYLFDCYFRSNEDTNTPLKRASLHLIVPRALTRVQSLVTHEFSSAVARTMHKFGGLYEQVGLENPWSQETIEGNGEGDTPTSGKEAEEAFRKMAHARAVEVLSEQLMRASLSSAFTFDRLGKSFVSPSAELEVDVFIGNGNVLVDKGLSPAEEIEATRRLRAFLVEFSVELNFDARRWWDVIFVLRPSTDKKYACKQAAKRIFVELPCSFKSRLLLDCLSANVPQAQLFDDLDFM